MRGRRVRPGDRMTPRQQHVYGLILEHYRDHGRAPTLCGLAKTLGVTLGGARGHVLALAARGLIGCGPNGRLVIEVKAAQDAAATVAADLLEKEAGGPTCEMTISPKTRRST